ncbi:MAG: hypothetical protein IKY54_02310 [Muribaculaceae bacterium]|nr:hypothetical protein [Muribaculaceae bacterium]
MQNIRNITLLLISVLFCSCLSSRIGDSTEETLSAEQSFMVTNFKENSVKDWKIGREFVCVVDELPMLLEPQKGVKDDYTNFKGTILKYKGIEEAQTWNGVESYIIYDDNEVVYKYRVSKPVSDILSSDFSPLLPELVSVDYIAQADSLLTDKTLYIKTPNWYSLKGEDKRERKFVPVMVQRVVAGNKIFPLALIFKTDDGEEAMVYTTMYASQYMSQYSTFDKLFTFTNPREKYSQIEDEVWQLITCSQVEQGMTKNECQISLGLPDEVDQIPGYSGLIERWMYNTGTYLEFKDGILVKFRLM